MANIAFTAQTNQHTSYGNSDVIEYEGTNLNHNSWDKRDFTAPENGCYHFALSFVRDAYYLGGTEDDIRVSLMKNNSSIGFAWTGEGDGKRASASLAVTLQLNAGDKIYTRVSSDGGAPRHIARAYFTGFKIG